MTVTEQQPEPVEQPAEAPEIPADHAAWVAHDCTTTGCGTVCKW